MDDKNLTPSLTLEDTPAAPSLTLDPFAEEEPLEATRRINLDDLKFGRNYSGGKD